MNYYIKTFGCQMNVTDSERIATVLEDMGYKPCSEIDKADLIVVNMCSVRQTAVDRVFGQIKNFKKLKKQNPKLKTILTGCVLKQDLKKFQEKYDYVLPKENLSHWKQKLKPPSNKASCAKPGLAQNSYLKIKPKYVSKFSACVPIITGCNNFCSYCVVPYTRGPEVSRPVKDILNEIKWLVENNYKEIWLIGENVNSYKSKNINFSKLLKMINDIPGNFWVRFTSSHPKDFTNQLIETIAKSEKITKYISLPVQSGDDTILKKMNRPYNIKQYKDLIKKIRKQIPNVVLSTDVIVGFGNETKKQFQNTIKLFQEIKPDMAYVAQYSPRQGTASYRIKDNVSHEEKIKRDKAITKTLKQVALRNNKKYIGETLEMLVEYERKGWLVGKTRNYKTIKIKIPARIATRASELARLRSVAGGQNLIGKFIKVKVVDTIPWGLKAEFLRSL